MIHPNGNVNKCLDVRGGVMANGTPVQMSVCPFLGLVSTCLMKSACSYDCNGTQAQKWVIKRGGQQIKVSGTNFCLDAGSSKFAF